MENLLLVAEQVGVLFALMAVGFACRRVRLLDDRSVKGLVDILVVIVTPAIVVQAFLRPFDAGMLRNLGFMAVAAILGHVFAIFFSGALVRGTKHDTRSVLRVSAVFSNAGFMGIPLTQAILGTGGVFYSVVYVAVFNVVIWSWGLCTIRGVSFSEMSRADVRTMFVNPGTIGLAFGLPLFFSSMHLPDVLSVPIRCLADLNTPLAMLVIGYYLAGARLGPIARIPAAYLSGIFRLVLYPLLVIGTLWGLSHGLNLDRTMMITLVISSAAPTAALPAMFAARYGSDIDTCVGLVSATTLFSILTMPLVIALALSVFA